MSQIRKTGQVRKGLLGGVLLAVVLGIFGMHALNTHAAMGSGHAGMSMTTDSPSTSRDSVAPVVADEVASVAPVMPDHNMGDMMMLCVFMVVAAAGLALLAILIRRRLPTSSWLLTRLTATHTPTRLPLGAGSGPPPVWAFSVIRC